MASTSKKYNTLKISKNIAAIGLIIFLIWSYSTLKEEEEKNTSISLEKSNSLDCIKVQTMNFYCAKLYL